jgi:hypothetical protein
MVSTLLFVCPATGQQVSTGIEIDRSSFKNLSRHTTELTTELNCPHCDTNHVLSGVWAWLDEGWRETRITGKSEHQLRF